MGFAINSTSPPLFLFLGDFLVLEICLELGLGLELLGGGFGLSSLFFSLEIARQVYDCFDAL